MAEGSNEDIVRAYFAAHAADDRETLARLRHPDWVVEWPQSGERVRGDANERAIFEHWPGGRPEAGQIHVVGSEDHWVVTPSQTLQRIVGSGDYWFAHGIAAYPDGSDWYASVLLELRDHQPYRETWFFGPPLEAPAWRSQWVERMR
jgi:hypothetical protein